MSERETERERDREREREREGGRERKRAGRLNVHRSMGRTYLVNVGQGAAA